MTQQQPNTGSAAPKIVPPEPIGPFTISEETFSEYQEGSLSGMSIMAKVTDGKRETEYSVSFPYSLDHDWNIVASGPEGAVETEEHLKERLREAVLSEVNDPRRALLIAKRFK